MKLSPDAIPFSYTRENDACMDMFCLEPVHVFPGQSQIVRTGIAVELPDGYSGIVRGRSGLASKGIFVHVGTVEEGYRGDVGIILCNTSREPFSAKAGSRLGQFTIEKVQRFEMEECTSLSSSVRGTNGYGSSGL